MNRRIRVESTRRELWLVEEKKSKKENFDKHVMRSQIGMVNQRQKIQGVINEEVNK